MEEESFTLGNYVILALRNIYLNNNNNCEIFRDEYLLHSLDVGSSGFSKAKCYIIFACSPFLTEVFTQFKNTAYM